MTAEIDKKIGPENTKRFNEMALTKTFETEKPPKNPKNRRNQSEIEKPFRCPIENCSKSYGSKGAALTHIKLKHAKFYSEHDHLALRKSLRPNQP